ncbi:MAG: hypothetical protein UY94_C0041G0009, partial [Parcubacteria group bacterium GW2011_GWA2_56_21]
ERPAVGPVARRRGAGGGIRRAPGKKRAAVIVDGIRGDGEGGRGSRLRLGAGGVRAAIQSLTAPGPRAGAGDIVRAGAR